MPLYWTIDSKERLFTGSGEGDVTFDDAMALLDALAGAKALSYRKAVRWPRRKARNDRRGTPYGVLQNQIVP
jgi:hypothetical protein